MIWEQLSEKKIVMIYLDLISHRTTPSFTDQIEINEQTNFN